MNSMYPPQYLHHHLTNNATINNNNPNSIHFKKKRKRIINPRFSPPSAHHHRLSSVSPTTTFILRLLLRILQWSIYILHILFCTIHRILMTRFVPSLRIKILFLVCPLAFFLYLWTGIEEDEDNNVITTTLATIIALKRHVPSKRVFDCMLEFALVGFCTSLLVYIWECTFYKVLSKEEQEIILDQLWYIPPLNEDIEYYYEDGDDEDDEEDVVEGDEENRNITIGGLDEQYPQVEMSHVRRTSGLEMSATTTTHRIPSTHFKQYPPSMNATHQSSITYNVDDGGGNIISSSNSKANDEKSIYLQQQRSHTATTTTTTISHQILHSSVDLLLLILVALFLFTMSETVGGYYIDELSSSTIHSKKQTTTPSLFAKFVSRIGAVAAPIFPLLLFVYASIHFLCIPWTKTKAKFWKCVLYTITTPMYPVTFRDGLVGDIITSLVRPLQDGVFTLVYFICGLRGWWIYNKIPDAIQTELLTSSAMESSWIIHTLLLPACILLPLWWRYVQTLRQVYQYRTRWPYLGNSGKYFCAAQIAILGMSSLSMNIMLTRLFVTKRSSLTYIYHSLIDLKNKGIMYPAWRSSPWGIFFFVLVTLYQVSWDVFMDWELLVWKKDGLVLREQRIFHNPSIYYFILTVNILLRFCWTMTFIPSRYLSPTSGLLMYTFSADFSTFKGPALASAEIIRRTLWTILRVEWEVLKVIQRPSASAHGVDLERNCSDESLDSMMTYKADSMTAMPIMQSMPSYRRHVESLQSIRSNVQDMIPILFSTTNMSSASEIQIIRELLIYATLFISFGIVAIIHRGVM